MNTNKNLSLSALALACSMGMMATSAQAVTVDFADVGKIEMKADAFVKGYHLDNGPGNFGPDESKKGAQSQVRLTMNMYNDSGWAIKTRLLGFYDWAGDRRHSGGSGTDYDNGINNDSISLDEAYLEYTGIDSWLFRVGRQEANWGYNFNIADDRRDRILAMKTLMLDTGYVGLIGIYDLRFAEDHSTNGLAPVSTGDLSMYTIAAVGNYSGLDWGVLWAYFDGKPAPDFPNEVSNPYYTDYFHNISPYFGKTMGDFSVKGAANIILSDANKDNAIYFWGNNSWSAFLEAGYQFTPEFQLQAQVAAIGDGGLVGRGWDSYSMLINSSSRNEINPVRTEFFGGFGDFNGNGGQDGLLYGLRANWNASEQLKVTFAVGRMDMDNYNANLSSVLPDTFRDNTKGTFYDIKALYEFSKGNSIEVRAGHADEDIDDTAILTTLRVSFG
ncbi:hypothetical protein [Shewanella marina]|uniref:hypothetical protein n=1 Tax=Shewanella marina TaxID=487319 RepID=UPI00046EE5E6|nr:hypothetical protein [Shewanella marina]